MKKRFLIGLLSLCLLLSAMVSVAYAEEADDTTSAAETTETTVATEATEEAKDPYSCGEDLTWSYSGGVLTVSGTGVMDDMSGGAPWEAHKNSITTVVFTGGVTAVGAQAFQNYDSIVSVDFGASMREINTQAFQDCDGLTSISLPSTFRRFGKESFADCSNLTEVFCAGGMPSFNANCLWNGNYITVYCPTNNIWPEKYVEELETNFGGRLEILAADGSDPFDFSEAEETTKATEPSTEATTEATTEPTTEPETEPVTEETTVPETEETTVPTTEETEEPTEEEETEAVTEPSAKRTGSAVGIAVVVMVLSALGIGAILFYLRRTKGGKFSA